MNDNSESRWLMSLDEKSFDYYLHTMDNIKKDKPHLTFEEAHMIVKEYVRLQHGI